jgi:hypothetical protein
MKAELEMEIEEDGAVALQKLSELARKAKELGFTVIEAEIEADEDDEEQEEEEDEEEEEK